MIAREAERSNNQYTGKGYYTEKFTKGYLFGESPNLYIIPEKEVRERIKEGISGDRLVVPLVRVEEQSIRKA